MDGFDQQCTVLDGSLERVMELQAAMASGPHGEQDTLPLLHHFGPEVYARSLLVPAGVALVGGLHLTAHLLIISMGSCDIISNGIRTHYEGFHIINTTPGTKRVIRAYTDTIMTTIHHTKETDLERLREELIAPDPLPLLEDF